MNDAAMMPLSVKSPGLWRALFLAPLVAIPFGVIVAAMLARENFSWELLAGSSASLTLFFYGYALVAELMFALPLLFHFERRGGIGGRLRAFALLGLGVGTVVNPFTVLLLAGWIVARDKGVAFEWSGQDTLYLVFVGLGAVIGALVGGVFYKLLPGASSR